MDDPIFEDYKRLVGPYKVTVVQEPDDGDVVVTTVTHLGLITQLRNAIHPVLAKRGAGGGGDSLPYNEDARQLLERLDRQIRRRHRDLHGAEDDGPPLLEAALSSWFQRFQKFARSNVLTEEVQLDARAFLKRAIAQIDALFDPPKRRELTLTRRRTREVVRTSTNAFGERVEVTQEEAFEERVPAPCPECGERYAMAGEMRVFALGMEYRIGERNALEDVSASCRACGQVWSGVVAVDELLQRSEVVDRDGFSPASECV